MADEKNRDLCLTPETFIFLQNEGKGGMISVYVGPCVVNQTGQDKPVVYDADKRRYRQVPTLEAAVQTFPRAQEGDYVVLENPAVDPDKFPTESVQQTINLQRGRKIIIPGPWSSPLWPGQSATVIPGHRLRSNEYLVVTIYNEEEARKNWSRAIAKPASSGADKSPTGDGADDSTDTAPLNIPGSVEFAVGKRLVIKGTDYSFYIPPTGVEVEKDEDGNFVRSAVTLEQLEYAILVDESGKKRYPQGPAVVFPEPDEQFITNGGKRKFRAIELVAGSGILVKVIQPYSEGSKSYAEGEEIFITAEETPIYRPREEHVVISYDGQNAIHFSTCVPTGEGRYVLDKKSGEIDLVSGPTMLLADPRRQTLVRRILTDDQCSLWYPGNQAAVDYNRNLRQVQSQDTEGTRQGVVGEQAYRSAVSSNQAGLENMLLGATASFASPPTAPTASLAPISSPSRESAGGVYMEKFQRASQYTPPRQITIDSRFDGVPSIKLYTGYAAMVVDKAGNRRVEVGPTNILLEYDETLEVLCLSTGKPKTTDKMYRTVYLRVANNKVSDIVEIETEDHVACQVKLSFCVNFEGDPNKWFDVENYVKYLCDHVRSVLKGRAKRYSVDALYRNYLEFVRDAILGEKPDGGRRPGMAFPENGMRVTDVEVLSFTLTNSNIAQLINQQQQAVVQQDIEIARARKTLETLKESETIQAETLRVKDATAQIRYDLRLDEIEREAAAMLAKIEADLKTTAESQKLRDLKDAIELADFESQQARQKIQALNQQTIEEAKAGLKLRVLDAETKSFVDRIGASKEGFSEALIALSREDVLVKVAEALRIETFMSGDGFENSLGRVVGGLPIFKQLMDRLALAGNGGNGNGEHLGGRLQQPAQSPGK